jgi:hypothetical protein
MATESRRVWTIDIGIVEEQSYEAVLEAHVDSWRVGEVRGGVAIAELSDSILLELSPLPL